MLIVALRIPEIITVHTCVSFASYEETSHLLSLLCQLLYPANLEQCPIFLLLLSILSSNLEYFASICWSSPRVSFLLSLSRPCGCYSSFEFWLPISSLFSFLCHFVPLDLPCCYRPVALLLFVHAEISFPCKLGELQYQSPGVVPRLILLLNPTTFPHRGQLHLEERVNLQVMSLPSYLLLHQLFFPCIHASLDSGPQPELATSSIFV
mmetsp:Transcript_28424/g.42015  ORF Transcript_28424/g.42015 Transcript_28424/m.42015 type:complete len:208 (-) Transcript_28424:572-1195(-)